MANDVKFVVNERGFNDAFQSWDGMTGRFIAQKAETLESLARLSAGYDSGALVGAIDTDYGKTAKGDLEAKTGAHPHADLGVGYAVFHHEGTKPHEIRPRRPGGVLKFRTRGIVVFATRVWHPGTTPAKYLTRWLKDVF